MLALVGGALWSQRTGGSVTLARDDPPSATTEPPSVATAEPPPTPGSPGPEVALLDTEKARSAASGGSIERAPRPQGHAGGGVRIRATCPPGDPLCSEPSGRVCFARIAPAGSTLEKPTSSPSCSNFERGDDSRLGAAQLSQSRAMGCSSVVAYSCPKLDTAPQLKTAEPRQTTLRPKMAL